MNDKVGQVAFPVDSSDGMPADRPYSEATAETMDEEARIIVAEAYQRTLDLLREKKDELTKVADLLLEKETITHDDIVDLIGARPFVGDENYNQYVSGRFDNEENEEKDDGSGEDNEESADDSATPLTPGLV